MKNYSYLIVVTSLMFSCVGNNNSSASAVDYNPDKKVVKVVFKDKDLGFKWLSNGTIPGGEVTQMYAQTADYNSNLSIRWGKDKTGSYDFNNPPSIKLELQQENGDNANFRPKEKVNVEKYYVDERVYKVVGEIEMKASNELAREISPEGGILKFELQKKKSKN